jgi:hypothetical protein
MSSCERFAPPRVSADAARLSLASSPCSSYLPPCGFQFIFTCRPGRSGILGSGRLGFLSGTGWPGPLGGAGDRHRHPRARSAAFVCTVLLVLGLPLHTPAGWVCLSSLNFDIKFSAPVRPFRALSTSSSSRHPASTSSVFDRRCCGNPTFCDFN